MLPEKEQIENIDKYATTVDMLLRAGAKCSCARSVFWLMLAGRYTQRQ